jgi:sulfite reductase alpha subunit-like flavoprotein
VFPENNSAVVEEVARRLGADLDAVFSLLPIDKHSKMTPLGPCTIRQALTQWCDLTNPPRKAVLFVLAQHAADPAEKERLLELANESKPVLPPTVAKC